MDFFKTVAGKVVGGLVALVVILIVISWIWMDTKTKQMLVRGTGKIVAWLLIVGLWPWVSFFVITWVGRMQSNVAGGLLVAGYTLLEVLLLLWLFGWRPAGSMGWVFVGVGGLLAAAYNLFACDWIAEKLE